MLNQARTGASAGDPRARDSAAATTTLPGALGVFLLSLVVAACGAALVTSLALACGVQLRPEKIADLALIGCFIPAFIVIGRRCRPRFLEAVALAGTPQPARRFLLGFAAGAVPMVLMNVALLLGGARVLNVHHGTTELLWRAVKILATLPILVIWEEGAFRGLLTGDLARASRPWIAAVLGAAIFAIAHFLRPVEGWQLMTTGWSSGPATVAACFHGMIMRGASEPRALIGLFLVGLVLASARLRSGSIWLSMGIHAGWVFIQKYDGNIVGDVPAVVDANVLWIGSKLYYDGIIGWVALGASALLIPRTKPAAHNPILEVAR